MELIVARLTSLDLRGELLTNCRSITDEAVRHSNLLATLIRMALATHSHRACQGGGGRLRTRSVQALGERALGKQRTRWLRVGRQCRALAIRML